MGVFEDVIAQSSRKPAGLAGVIERRSEKRAPMLRSSTTSLTSSLWELELVPAFGLIRLCEDIDDLAKRSLEQNMFFESTVLRAAWPRLTNLLAPRGAWMLCLWETTGESRKLQLFMPVRINKTGWPRKMVLQPLSNEYMPVGTPLIDRENAGEATEILLRLLSDPNLKLPQIIDFTHQRKTGPVLDTIKQAATNLGLEIRESATHQRAALIADHKKNPPASHALSRKAVRELMRQRRKMEETGKLQFKIARGEKQLLDALEHFLTLELRGWKGRHGTALYNHKKIAAFSRQIVAELATMRGCEIHTMSHDDQVIGALILLGSNGRLVPWKMAFDERHGNFSPGMQIMLEATEALIERKSFIEADSLAVADHWMMNRIWPDRITITDCAIALAPESAASLEELIAAKYRLVRIKTSIKSILIRSRTLVKKVLDILPYRERRKSPQA